MSDATRGSGGEAATVGRLPSAGVELAWRRWPAEGEARGVVVLVHGVNEHAGRYGNLVGPLTRAGFVVYGYDHRGHGRSSGLRGHVDRWTDYRMDLAAFLSFVGSREPGRPRFLYAHSMGALVAVDLLVADAGPPPGLAGAVLSGPPFQPGEVAKPWLVWVARRLSGVVPWLTLDLGIPTSALSRDPVVVEAFDRDPLCGRKVSVRWGTELLDTIAACAARADRIALPTLWVHGGDDPVNLVAGTRRFVDAVHHPDKTLAVYAGSRHEVHNDLEHPRLAADVVDWLRARV